MPAVPTRGGWEDGENALPNPTTVSITSVTGIALVHFAITLSHQGPWKPSVQQPAAPFSSLSCCVLSWGTVMIRYPKKEEGVSAEKLAQNRNLKRNFNL